MKKIIVIFLAILIMSTLFVLVGCDSTVGTPKEETVYAIVTIYTSDGQLVESFQGNMRVRVSDNKSFFEMKNEIIVITHQNAIIMVKEIKDKGE